MPVEWLRLQHRPFITSADHFSTPASREYHLSPSDAVQMANEVLERVNERETNALSSQWYRAFDDVFVRDEYKGAIDFARFAGKDRV